VEQEQQQVKKKFQGQQGMRYSDQKVEKGVGGPQWPMRSLDQPWMVKKVALME
jgi:hypothetical protein